MKKIVLLSSLCMALLTPLVASAQSYPGASRDRDYCMSGRSGQPVQVCIREMRAAHFENLREDRRDRHDRMERREDRMDRQHESRRMALERCDRLRYERERQVCADHVMSGNFRHR